MVTTRIPLIIILLSQSWYEDNLQHTITGIWRGDGDANSTCDDRVITLVAVVVAFAVEMR